MRDYGQVRPRFWIQGTGRELRGDHEARLVALYLCTAPTSNLIGLYYLPVAVVAHEVGLTLEGAREALSRVCTTGFAQYDDASEYVWVVNMTKEQVGNEPKKTDNRIGGVRKELLKHEKSPFYTAFCEKYEAYFGVPLRRVVSPVEAPSKGLGRASVGAGESGAGTGAGTGAARGASAPPPSVPEKVAADHGAHGSKADGWSAPLEPRAPQTQTFDELFRQAAFARDLKPAPTLSSSQRSAAIKRVLEHAADSGVGFEPAASALIAQAFDDSAATGKEVCFTLTTAMPGKPAQPRRGPPGPQPARPKGPVVHVGMESLK